MPLFNRQSGWRGTDSTTVVELLILFAFAFAVFGYVKWSSSTVVAEFKSPARSSASDLNHASKSSTPIQSFKGQTGCPQGKRSLPTQLVPMP